MGMVLMSKRELNRIDVLARLESGHLTPAAAAELLRVSERQVYRLVRHFRDSGPAGIADRRRGHPSNNRLPAVLRDHAVSLVREHYRDFGPTLAALLGQGDRDLQLGGIQTDKHSAYLRHGSSLVREARRRPIRRNPRSSHSVDEPPPPATNIRSVSTEQSQNVSLLPFGIEARRRQI